MCDSIHTCATGWASKHPQAKKRKEREIFGLGDTEIHQKLKENAGDVVGRQKILQAQVNNYKSELPVQREAKEKSARSQLGVGMQILFYFTYFTYISLFVTFLKVSYNLRKRKQ